MAINASSITTSNTLEQLRQEFNNLVTDVSGLGQGRMFSEEPLAGIDAYGEVVIRDADDVNCCGKPQEVFNYYGDAVLPENSEYLSRNTVMGGRAMHGGDPKSYNV